MPNQASERLVRLNDRIMAAWEARAKEEVDAATHQSSLALRDSLPEFLGQIATALSGNSDRTAVWVRRDRQEITRVGKKHGRERAATFDYTMDQLIFEYHILRQVIFDFMEEEAPLSPVEREIIICAVEQAVNDAATQFNDTLQDIQEKLTHTLAHDIRGPIASAKLSAQLLLRNPSDEDRRMAAATRIANAMDRMDRMIHELLDASRLRAGEDLALELKDCDLNLILTQVADEMNFTQGNRVSLISAGSAVGQWDERALRRVLDNLVTNALKFSPPESQVTLELKTTTDSVEVSVHNLGKAIPAEDQGHLFQKFKRARNAKTSEGWGLGLTVVKGITEAHRGQVAMVSKSESGTVFTVKLPWSSSVNTGVDS